MIKKLAILAAMMPVLAGCAVQPYPYGTAVVYQPAPVYVAPRPVYVAPRPVYVPPPVYAAPRYYYPRYPRCYRCY